MVVHKTILTLAALLLLSFTFVHCQKERIPFDPSTVINVYPSLQKLNKGSRLTDMSADDEGCVGGYQDDDNDSDEDGEEDGDEECASASNVKQTWLAKTTDKELKKAKASESTTKQSDLRPNKEHRKAKISFKARFKDIGTATPYSTDTTSKRVQSVTITPDSAPSKVNQDIAASADIAPRVHNWNSFQDMLQILRKLMNHLEKRRVQVKDKKRTKWTKETEDGNDNK